MDAEEPTPQYLKGFNSGYQIAKYDPELFSQLAKTSHLNKDNDYIRGLEMGKKQLDREKLLEQLNQSRQRSNGRNLER